MKTHIGKIAFTGLLALALTLPKYSIAQDDNSQPSPQGDQSQYQNPSDTPPDQNDQQLDQQEAQQTAPPSDQPVTTQVFYDQLSPYGQWVNYGNYGYVWIPNAVPNFTPYSSEGHWVYTVYGWTWLSDYPWGWAVFHYGRWAYDNSYGWFWVPGYQWGPAWVAWRHCDGYYGWAPLYPGLDITVNFDWWDNIPANYWCFVNEQYIGDRYVWRHYEPRNYNSVYIRRTTIINNTYYDRDRHVTYAAGPQREDVERAMHTTVRPVPVHESTFPQQRYDQAHLHLYRPNVTAPRTDDHSAPTRSVPIQQVPQRNVQYNSQQGNNWHENQQRQTPQQQPQRQQPQQPIRQQQAQPRSVPQPSGGNRGGNGGNNGGGGRRH